jgi:transcriptional regulator with XRE-family HTH domain
MKPTTKPQRTAEQRAEEEAIRRQHAANPVRQRPAGAINQEGFAAILNLVARFKAVRESQGLTLAEVAERMGIDAPALSRLETGKMLNPTVATLYKWAEALGEKLAVGASDMCQDEFRGPDDLAGRILQSRRESDERGERGSFAEISGDGVRRLIRIAYYSSQLPNEGRYPRLTLLVPAREKTVYPVVAFEPDELTVQTLRRIGPTLASQDYALLVREPDKVLQIQGIVQLRGSLTELDLGDRTASPLDRPRGLYVEVFGPGDLRAREVGLGTHRLQAGQCRRECSFVLDRWFEAWLAAASAELFDGWTRRIPPERAGWPIRPDFAISRVWLTILRKAASLRHGGCFVIAPDPPSAIGPTFTTSGCDVGAAIVENCKVLRQGMGSPEPLLSPETVRTRILVREQLLSLIDAAAELSSTDGCVVFNQRLQLQSFGSMIDIAEDAGQDVPCYIADTMTPVDNDEIRHSFGARRRSAIQLCRACRDAMAFVLSQDGDLRVFVRRDDAVRFYDNAVVWSY